MAIPVNGVHVPFKESVKSIQRFCRPLLFYNENSDFELSFGGSCFLFRNGGRNFVLSTKHQFDNLGRDPKDLALIFKNADGTNSGLNPNEANRINIDIPENKDLEDVLVAEYDDNRGAIELPSHFLNVDVARMADLTQVPANDVQLIFTIGYPNAHAKYDFEDDGSGNYVLDLVSRWAVVYLELTERDGFDKDLRLPLQAHDRYHNGIGDPDGFSGSPVFFLYFDKNGEGQLGFAGMVTDASLSGRFNVYEARYLKQIFADV